MYIEQEFDTESVDEKSAEIFGEPEEMAFISDKEGNRQEIPEKQILPLFSEIPHVPDLLIFHFNKKR